MSSRNGVDPGSNAWNWVHIPWLSAIAFVLAGSGGIWVGIALGADSFVFRAGFVGIGVATWICAFLLPKTRLSIERDKMVLQRTTGPWIGPGGKTTSIRVDSVRRVVFRWDYFIGRKKGASDGSIHRLFLEDAEGGKWDIFPPDSLCMFPKRCGQSLADYLNVEFNVEGDIHENGYLSEKRAALRK